MMKGTVDKMILMLKDKIPATSMITTNKLSITCPAMAMRLPGCF